MSFKVRVDSLSPALFCCLHITIPRTISGCQDRASNLDRSPVRRTRYHYVSSTRLISHILGRSETIPTKRLRFRKRQWSWCQNGYRSCLGTTLLMKTFTVHSTIEMIRTMLSQTQPFSGNWALNITMKVDWVQCPFWPSVSSGIGWPWRLVWTGPYELLGSVNFMELFKSSGTKPFKKKFSLL